MLMMPGLLFLPFLCCRYCTLMDQRASVLKDYAVIDSLVDIVAALLLPVIAHLDSCLPSGQKVKVMIGDFHREDS